VAVPGHPRADTDSIIRVVRVDLGEVSDQAVHAVLRAPTAAGLPRRIRPPGSMARYESRAGDNRHHVVRRSCGAVDTTPCSTASDGHGFAIDEAEVVHRDRCPGCGTATSAASGG
jgi:Fur family ferric uptake transcriptional regulator